MQPLISLFHRLRRSRRSRPLQERDLTADIFARLPFELILLILAHLEPSGLSAATRASRTLRSVLLSDEVWPILADLWFPSLAAYVRSAAVNEEDRCQLFQRALHRISKRIDGKFASAVHHDITLESDRFFQLSKNVPIREGGVHSYEIVQEMDLNPDQRFLRFMMYSNGRIAWWPEAFSLPYFAVVDDFRTRTRRAYLFPHHEGQNHGYLTVMGDKLLILCRDTTVHAWHLELDRLQSFELPETFKRCTTEGETVLIVSKSADVFIWKYGQALRYIDMGDLPCYAKGPVCASGLEAFDNITLPFAKNGLYLQANQQLIDFILSPNDADTFFVITLPRDSPRQLTAYEIHCGNCIGSYNLDVHMLHGPAINYSGYLRSEKSDSYGGYSLIHALTKNLNAIPSSIRGNYIPCSCSWNAPFLITVCFNIYTRSFTVLYHPLPASLTLWTFHLWNSRLSLGNYQPDVQSTLHENYVTSLKPCNREQVCFDAGIPYSRYSTMPTDTSSIYRRRLITPGDNEPLEEHSSVDFALKIHQQYITPNPNRAQPRALTQQIVGDDSFLLFIQDKKYTVWSFGDEIPAKPVGAGQKKTLWRRS